MSTFQLGMHFIAYTLVIGMGAVIGFAMGKAPVKNLKKELRESAAAKGYWMGMYDDATNKIDELEDKIKTLKAPKLTLYELIYRAEVKTLTQGHDLFNAIIDYLGPNPLQCEYQHAIECWDRVARKKGEIAVGAFQMVLSQFNPEAMTRPDLFICDEPTPKKMKNSITIDGEMQPIDFPKFAEDQIAESKLFFTHGDIGHIPNQCGGFNQTGAFQYATTAPRLRRGFFNRGLTAKDIEEIRQYE